MKFEKTDRGFFVTRFKDRYGTDCSLQKSSLASEDCIWLGVTDVEPKILCTDAAKAGLTPISDCGWMPYPIPDEVLLNTRMHLTRSQVEELLPLLKAFVETGNLT